MDYYSGSYEESRSRFLEGIAKLGGVHREIPLGHDLCHDYGWLGNEKPTRVVLHIAGTHGVEGFVGAAIQLAIFERSQSAINEFLGSGGTIVFLHALNPWGFKNVRRVNAENVDLNRNFLFPWTPPEASAQYRGLNNWLNPPEPSSALTYYLTVLKLLLQHGIPALKQALAGGQASFPKGIYYCGDRIQIETSEFVKFLETHLTAATKISGIEIHSGLGGFGQSSIFGFGRHGTKQAISQELGTEVIDDDPNEVGIATSGDIGRWFEGRFNSKGHHWFLQEFGTFHPIQVLKALRDENAAFHSGRDRLLEKKQLLKAFCPDGHWRREVLESGLLLFEKTLRFTLK